VHMSNIAHQLSPSFLPVLKRYGIPLVMTLRDYKIVCPSYAMFGPEGVCDRCAGGRYYHCLLRRCTKGSYAKSLVNTLEMYLHHRWMGVYELIDEFISPSRFLAERVKAMGFARHIRWLPNFVEVDHLEPGWESDGRTLVYFGRLSREKGLLTLLEAVKGLRVRLRIVGDGPLREELGGRVRSGHLTNVCLVGYHSGPALHEIIRSATAVVLPSEWYENNPRCLLEGFALGKCAIASRIGGIGELVTPGRTGWLFEAGNVRALRTTIQDMLANPENAVRMGRYARADAQRFYGPDRHYRRLMAIYRAAARRALPDTWKKRITTAT
jgi:glycosyltransferase involved in cell wall biosynthesis